MTKEKTYEEIDELLRSRGFSSKLVRLLDNTNTKSIGVSVYCPSLLKHLWEENIQQTVGNDFKVSFIPNSDELYIKRKSEAWQEL